MAARDVRLLFGPLAAIVFAVGVALLPSFVPGYSAVRQTVSEIGEVTSPMRVEFAALLWLVAFCVLVFAVGLLAVARRSGRGALGVFAALCAGWMSVAAAAIGWFAYPEPLHNVFGMSQLIAYQAPLLYALAWRRPPRVAVGFSILMYVLTVASVALNLYAIADTGAFWDAVAPYYGLLQRSLFACFFVWCAGAGWLLWQARA